MKKKIGLLLAAVMVLNTVSSMAFGFTNPLKNYNLYDDTHPTNSSSDNSSTERGMEEFYSNSMSASSSNSSNTSSYNDSSFAVPNSTETQTPQRRNEVLRESSRDIFSDGTTPWLEGPSFYENPTFESIKEKYKQSNFAGCLQECISYVRQNPNDTLGFYYLAMCYAKVSDKENAISAYEKVIALNDNPMIVKYATNGRNCVMDSNAKNCYQNVNEPELLYPYANANMGTNLTPVDPQTLINRNLVELQNKLSPKPKEDEQNQNNNNNEKDKDKNKIVLPFGQQDEKLDKFINAPYGNGLSPDLNKQYKQIQLKKIQQNINNEKKDSDDDTQNLENIQNFDDHKTDSETIKLAYNTPSNDMESFLKDPQYQQAQREMNELRMLLGSDSQKNSNDDLMNLVPYISDKDKNMSPEMIEAMMVKSMMPDFTFVNNDSKNLL